MTNVEHVEPEQWFPPRADVDSARHDSRLQAEHSREVADERRARADLGCSECGSRSLAWFWFESPPRTWATLCGTAGPLCWCDRCDRQVAYFEHVVN